MAKRTKKVTKQCLVCKKDFTRWASYDQKYCSRKCFYKARRKKNHATKQCPVCKKDFTSLVSNGRKYCSVKCALTPKPQNHVTKQCPVCKKEFTRGVSRNQKYCSSKCATEATRKKPGSRWKDESGWRIRTEDGRRMMEHRYLMEKIIRRKLHSHERVHHIDCDQYNNDPQDLHLCCSHSHHMKCHGSLNRLVKELLASGAIQFNEVEETYELGPLP